MRKRAIEMEHPAAFVVGGGFVNAEIDVTVRPTIGEAVGLPALGRSSRPDGFQVARTSNAWQSSSSTPSGCNSSIGMRRRVFAGLARPGSLLEEALFHAESGLVDHRKRRGTRLTDSLHSSLKCSCSGLQASSYTGEIRDVTPIVSLPSM